MKYLPLLLLAFAACSAADNTVDSVTKEQVASQIKADGITSEQLCEMSFGYKCDLCEELQWYGDGICDEFCSLPDTADCGDVDGGPGYDPCSGLSCGDTCNLCDPNDPSCAESSEFRTCSEFGECGNGLAYCDDGLYADAGTPDSGAYDPCNGLSCGNLCNLCDPNDPNCAESSELRTCNEFGDCGNGLAYCDDGIFIDGGTPDSGAYEACGAGSCGQTCTVCNPADPNCVETAEVKWCNGDRECLGGGEPLCVSVPSP